MIRNILIGVLAVAVAGTAFWGYQEHREKNAILVNSENNYQRAFHDLTYQIDLLHDKIGTTLAMNSRNSLSPALADVWRITSEAHTNVGELPLTILPFNKTEEFLSQIGDFSYQTAVRDLEKEPLSDKEYAALNNLYGQSADIQKELRKVQHMVLANNLRWMDVDMALASGDEPDDNTIIDGFKTVEKTVEGYSETDFGPAFVNMQEDDRNFNRLEGPKINEKKAVQIARQYTGMGKDVKAKVTENGDGSEFGFYSVSMEDRRSNLEATMDVTKKGGHPIWFMVKRDVKNQKISLNEASNNAARYLQDNGFQNLDLFESSQYDNVGVLTFVTSQDGVRVYPDSIRVQVAMDNGQIIGLSAEDYLRSHQTREMAAPVLTEEEARAKINPNVEIMENRLAVIMNDLNQEVLCYEFLGTLGNDTYRVYINAESGDEEEVEKLHNAEATYEDVV
ncbi:germination protein YpeB [Bacillus canaveralius]|uniref:Germination protein YpeB n=1 Tax=Bacillus canaveralius TaxID=1403243 RepID=A0A2N5GRR3_9BACI|nr:MULTISPECIES: germination protein YpeB [Bacillus]PLR83063.1 germination protein YpeB [Bacillus sp. V33-4]PLR86119.1 germination protein YpeB [Bacillus canaveralius]PLS00239.1 germination protein YpeB [Bacillus canaveralius]RSK51997.1 germination protein YpeB [Bacillus canaveralius]